MEGDRLTDAMIEILKGFPVDAHRFFEALGRFVAQFAETEARLQITLWRCAELETPTAQAVLNGARVDQAMSLLKRLAAAHKWPEASRNHLDYLSSQLGDITKLRNDLLHFGAKFDDGDDWLVSNKQFIHLSDRLREIRISPDGLKAATDDLGKIESHFLLISWSEDRDNPVGSQLIEAETRPWRYKSS